MITGFVAGATGLTGRAVVSSLTRHGARAVAHVRPDSARLNEWRHQLGASGAEVDATPWDEAAMRASFERLRPTHVFGCLGTTRARAKTAARDGRDPGRESYEAVDVALTELVLRCAKSVGVTRFVYLSSIGAGGSGGNAYLAARTKVEATLRASGVPYTIARPSFIVGDREKERASERTFGAIADAGLRVVGALGGRGVRDRYRSITGEQLGEALVVMALDPAWANRIAEGADLQAISAPAR